MNVDAGLERAFTAPIQKDIGAADDRSTEYSERLCFNAYAAAETERKPNGNRRPFCFHYFFLGWCLFLSSCFSYPTYASELFLTRKPAGRYGVFTPDVEFGSIHGIRLVEQPGGPTGLKQWLPSDQPFRASWQTALASPSSCSLRPFF